MKNKTHSIVASACLLIVVTTSAKAQEPELSLDLLKESSKIVFLGDSITYAGGYIAEFDWWVATNDKIENKPHIINLGLPSETVSGLSEDGHAGGKFPRPDLKERLGRTLEAIEPDLVIACYGINCGIYQPFDENRFQAYRDGIQNLVDKVEFAGAKLILVTPPTYDDGRSKLDFSYNEVMTRYSEWMVTHGAENEWHVIDLHSALKVERDKQLRAGDEFTFQPDAVHLNREGHMVVAQTLVRAFEPDYTRSFERRESSAIANCQMKMYVWRNAFLLKIGHARPGLEKGLTLEEAEIETQRIESLHRADFKLLESKDGKR